MKVQKINSNSNNLYSVYYCNISSLKDLVEVSIPTKFFSLLLCADFREIGTDDISYVAEMLLEKGNLYFCAWGPDCERAHDIYDEVIVINEIQHLVMTTWHHKESLDDTLWFVLYSASIHEKEDDDCSTIIVTVDNNQWRKGITENLSDIEAFNQRTLNELGE